MDCASDKAATGVTLPEVDVFFVDWESIEHAC